MQAGPGLADSGGAVSQTAGGIDPAPCDDRGNAGTGLYYCPDLTVLRCCRLSSTCCRLSSTCCRGWAVTAITPLQASPARLPILPPVISRSIMFCRALQSGQRGGGSCGAGEGGLQGTHTAGQLQQKCDPHPRNRWPAGSVLTAAQRSLTLILAAAAADCFTYITTAAIDICRAR